MLELVDLIRFEEREGGRDVCREFVRCGYGLWDKEDAFVNVMLVLSAHYYGRGAGAGLMKATWLSSTYPNKQILASDFLLQ